MSRKSKYSFEFKIQAVKQYLNGKGSYPSLANALGVNSSNVKRWVKAYKANGEDALKPQKYNQSYSKEFKLNCVAAYLAGEGSYQYLTNKFGLKSDAQLRQWVIKYNSHQELKDYNPIPEAYMTSKRKTTLEERQNIVKYCQEHNWNYNETALKFACSYGQVYRWCKKYQEQGLEGLKDKRGHHLNESELSETEKLRREVERLKVENRVKDRQIDFLKKVKDLERMWMLDNQNKDE